MASSWNLSILTRSNAKQQQNSQSFGVTVSLSGEMEVAEAEGRGSDQERMRHRRAVVTWPCETPTHVNSPQDS